MSGEKDSNLTELLKAYNETRKERAKKIKSIHGQLRENVEALLDSCKKYLHGQYQLNSIYEDSNNDPMVTYGLVYAEYYEKDCGQEAQFLNTYKLDARLLHKKLQQSGLALDYYHILPYYNPLQGSSVLYNTHIISTHELEIE